MKKPSRDELLKELSSIYKEGMQFFKNASTVIAGVLVTQPADRPYERDEFWKNLPASLSEIATSLISRIIEIAPLIAESARMTSYLTQSDQIDLGHAIKGMRSALRLSRYRYWEPDILHDEGTVLGIRPAGQSDDEGIHPGDAKRVFTECFRRINSVVIFKSKWNFK